ncbi:MAG: lipopolysaccharide transport periplasmic protein LptA [Gammaproteobacteria bacterium]
MSKLSKLFIILLTLLPWTTQALESDNDQPMLVSSDSAQINSQNGIGIYRGNVRFNQGTSYLTADYAETFTDEDNNLVSAFADGVEDQRAHYWTLTDIDKPELHARADRIEYQAEENKIYLIGNAEVIQGEDSYHAPIIEYDTEKEEVISPEDDQGRTVIILQKQADS